MGAELCFCALPKTASEKPEHPALYMRVCKIK